MSKYRLDVIERGVRQPGRVLFHADTPRETLDAVAAEYAQRLHRPVELVAVETVRMEEIEILATFDGDPDPARTV